MKYSLLKTKLGWTGVGTEDGAICAITLGPTKDAALRELLERGADGPAGAKRVAPLIDLVRRAAGGAPRAGGRAVAATPVPILLPCHRGVASEGGRGGFGGGLPMKKTLLRAE